MSEPTMEDIKAHMPNKTLPTTGSATKDPTCKEVGALYDAACANARNVSSTRGDGQLRHFAIIAGPFAIEPLATKTLLLYRHLNQLLFLSFLALLQLPSERPSFVLILPRGKNSTSTRMLRRFSCNNCWMRPIATTLVVSRPQKAGTTVPLTSSSRISSLTSA